MTLNKVLLVGSTGTIGKYITAAFATAASRNVFERVAIFTSQNTVDTKKDIIEDLKSKNVEIIVGDLGNDQDVQKTFEGQGRLVLIPTGPSAEFDLLSQAGFDVVISALGRGALHLQSRLVDIFASLPKLASGQPRRFYPSEYGTDIRYDPVTSPHEKPHQNKLATRAHIEALAKDNKIEFTYIVTGPFLDTFIYARAGGRAGYDQEAGTFGIVGSEEASQQPRISGTTYEDTGRFVLSSLLTPASSANATLRVSSIDSKPTEIKDAVATITGKPVKAIYTSLEDFKALENKAWDDKDPAATVFTLTRIWYEGGSDFTKKPRALYYRGGREEEDQALEKQLFADVPRKGLDDVLRGLL